MLFLSTIISALNDYYRWPSRSDNRKGSRIAVGPRIRSYYYSLMRLPSPRILALNATCSAPFFSNVLPTIPAIRRSFFLTPLHVPGMPGFHHCSKTVCDSPLLCRHVCLSRIFLESCNCSLLLLDVCIL